MMMMVLGVLLHSWIWEGKIYLYINEEPAACRDTDLLLWKASKHPNRAAPTRECWVDGGRVMPENVEWLFRGWTSPFPLLCPIFCCRFGMIWVGCAGITSSDGFDALSSSLQSWMNNRYLFPLIIVSKSSFFFNIHVMGILIGWVLIFIFFFLALTVFFFPRNHIPGAEAEHGAWRAPELLCFM